MPLSRTVERVIPVLGRPVTRRAARSRDVPASLIAVFVRGDGGSATVYDLV